MKTCKTCAWFAGVLFDDKFRDEIAGPWPNITEGYLRDACMRNMKTDPVSGKQVYQSAHRVRENNNRCGVEGQWWEDKTSRSCPI